jgi:dCMP deaminase
MANKWTMRFLNLAKEISTWSIDPSTKVGAVIVDKNKRIVETGYNGFPRGVKDLPERLNNREEKYKYVVHAEMNCIYNACHNGTSLNDTTLYVYGLPICSECAKGVAQVGISKVIMQHPNDIPKHWEEKVTTSKIIFNEAGVKFLRYSEKFEPI